MQRQFSILNTLPKRQFSGKVTPISSDGLERIRASWVKVLALDPSMEAQGVILFRHIFAIAPEAKAMFSFKDEPDMFNSKKLKKHGKGVMKYVDAALKDFSGTVKGLQSLGSRHLTKDVAPAHYDAVGQAFVATLSDALGDDLTPELQADWVTVYTMMIEVMKGSHYDE